MTYMAQDNGKMCYAAGAGFLCGLVLMMAVQNVSHGHTMALTTARPAVLPGVTSHVVPAPLFTGALPRIPPLASSSGYSRAPLDPLNLSSPQPEFKGFTKVLVVLAGIVLLPVIAVVFLYQKVCMRNQYGVEDVIYDHRISMLAALAEAEEETKAAPKPVSKKMKLRKPKGSRRRRALEALYTKKQLYAIEEALQLAKNTSSAKFTESIDVAVNLGIDPRKSDQMVRGSVVLPAGTGKVVRVAAFCQGDALDKAKAAGAEFYGLQDLADLIKGGELGFDVVVATPDSMRIALQLGKILGPRGLMPNPKDGTVNPDIEEAIRNAKAGQVKYRSDKAGTVHCPIGKSDFDIAKLKTNLNTLLKELMKIKPAAVKGVYMKKVVVSSSMGPGIYVDISTTDASR